MKRWGGVVGTVVVTALLIVSPSAGAATTIVVNTTADNAPSGSECSGVAGDCSLRQALSDASSGDTISVPAGTYTLTSGALTDSTPVTIDGAGASGTVISGNNSSQVFVFTGAGNVTVSGVTVTDGLNSVPNGTAEGGGIYSDASTNLTLSGVEVTSNEADASGATGESGGYAAGGGVYTAGNLTVTDSVISGNQARAVGASGQTGGLAQGGGLFDDASAFDAVTLQNVAFDSNTADANGGAGGDGDLAEGGSLENNNSAAPMTLANVAISRSSATADGSGATGNGATAAGGGMEARSTATLTNVTISQNTSDGSASGGGDGGAAVDGGGLMVRASVTLLNDTLSGNTAIATGASPGTAKGGNLENKSGSVSIENSIVSSGTGDAGSANCSGTLTSVGHNVDSLDQCDFTATGDKVNTDPKLGPLQSNGGPLETQALLAGSPAIHAADSADCPSTDERGVARPAGACDIGAYQFAPPTVLTEPATAITQTGANIGGTVNPNTQNTTYDFEYGTSTDYTQSTASQGVGDSNLASPVSIALASLKPHTTYHYAIVATNADGTAVGSDRTFTTPPAPVVHVRIKPTSFATARRRHRHAKVGAKVTFTLNTPATVVFGIQVRRPGRRGAHGQCQAPSHKNLHRRRCVGWMTLHGHLTSSGHTGANSFKFKGRWAGKRLAPGSYRLATVPVAGGIRGTGALTKFRIVL